MKSFQLKTRKRVGDFISFVCDVLNLDVNIVFES